MHKHQEFESNQRMNVAVVAITSALCTVWTCFALFQFSSLYVVCVCALLFHTDLTKRKDYSLSIIRCPNKSATASVWQYILLFSFRCSVINCVFGSMVSACHLIIFAILKQFRRKTEWIKVAFGLLAASWLENHTKDCNIVMVCISVLATKFKLHAVCTIQQTNIEMSECNTRLEWVNETENRNVYDQVLNQIARTHKHREKPFEDCEYSSEVQSMTAELKGSDYVVWWVFARASNSIQVIARRMCARTFALLARRNTDIDFCLWYGLITSNKSAQFRKRKIEILSVERAQASRAG